jgi:hypothetical protein
MKKLLFTFLLFNTAFIFSQSDPNCEYVQIDHQFDSSTCIAGVSIRLNVTFLPGEIEVYEIALNLRNETQNSNEIIVFNNPDPNSPQAIGIFELSSPYSAGDNILITSEIHTNLSDPFECLINNPDVVIPSCSSIDLDGDTYTADVDCDDSNSNIYPGATEVCNHKDDNCDGEIDEGVNFIYYWDEDDDGFGDPDRPIASCSATPTNKLSINNLDCDDENSFIFPGAPELCDDSVDNNCDGTINEGCNGCTDSDSDSVCDESDICPGFDDLADVDVDGIPDGCDNCPNLSNPSQLPDGDCDGVLASVDCNDNDHTITDRLDLDTDNDGTPDCLDQCPNDKTKTLPGSCGCGNKETDRDADGIADCIDQELRSPCPNSVDDNGVSLDDDNDTVPNCLDKCSGYIDANDLDGDKIPDGCDSNPYCRGDKITVCHNRNGVLTTLCVSPGQVGRHISHGDNLGPCNEVTAEGVIYETSAMIEEDNSKIDEEQMSIYPNPAGNYLNIRLNSITQNETIYSIFNLNGVKVKEGEIISLETKIELDGSVISGLYIVIVQNGKSRITKRFIIEK